MTNQARQVSGNISVPREPTDAMIEVFKEMLEAVDDGCMTSDKELLARLISNFGTAPIEQPREIPVAGGDEEVIRAAARKWFYTSFDDDLLERMQKHGLIAQAEGFSISVMAELELAMEEAFSAHITRLHAEVERLTKDNEAFIVECVTRGNAEVILQSELTTAQNAYAIVLDEIRAQAEKGMILQSELTKARECLKDLGVEWESVADMYQSAPAAKGESDE